MKITSYIDAVKYLESFVGKVIFKIDKEFLKEHDPLERMRVLLPLLDNPQDKFRSVIVGGTSGKGSTSYLISHILTTAGYKTGFTLSPHLEKINERLQINGRQISDDNFVKLLKTLMLPSIRKMSKMKIGAPSYFEILVGMAFAYFADQKVDIAVAEVGMGGEFDATNTLNPLIAVLTNVGLDHTNILGKSISKIARTKAGIIKIEDLRFKIDDKTDHKSLIINRRPPVVVSGVKQQSVIKIVADRCEEVGAKLSLLWRDFGYRIKKENIKGSVFDLILLHGREVKLNDLWLSLLGDYQIENASLAIETVLQLRKFGFEVTDDTIRKALSTAFFPGRFEVVSYTLDAKHYTLIFDGAHNPTKMEEFLKSLKKLFFKERKVFIVGFKFDKDIQKMLKQITKVADKIIITEFNRATDMAVSASADALKIKNQISRLAAKRVKIQYGGEIIIEKDSKKALDKALAIQQFSNSTIIVATGSLYLVGEVRSKIALF